MASRLPRTGSFSGVWWKLGDGRLRDEEAAVKACIHRRQELAREVRRNIALEAVYALWAATRRRRAGTTKMKMKMKMLLLLPLCAIPALAAIVLAAFARFHKFLDARDQQKLQRLAAEREAGFRGSHHNMQNLIQKYDPDAAEPAAATLKRTHSRLSFHVGDE